MVQYRRDTSEALGGASCGDVEDLRGVSLELREHADWDNLFGYSAAVHYRPQKQKAWFTEHWTGHR